MRALSHVACLPFPSPQGTQAAIASMLEALGAEGVEAALFCYPHGDARLESRVSVVRLGAPALSRSLRSGPSLAKLALDVAMVDALRRAPARGPLVCHHVEAAWAARLAGREYVYVAHTSLEDELATYLPSGARGASGLTSRLGARVDAFALGGALRAAAVSPALGRRLEARHGRRVDYLPVPWSLGERGCRERARRGLGYPERALVVLYTGNLDGYQRWEEALRVVRLLRDRGEDARLLVATESDARPLFALAGALGLEALTVRGLASERDRRLVHAAADVALVPRTSPGGVPIKLLDALARGVPVVTTEIGAAGLPLEGAVSLGSTTEELALACLEAGRDREALAARGRAFLRDHHAPISFVDAYRRLVR